MANIKIHAGDLPKGEALVGRNCFAVKHGFFNVETIMFDQFETVEVASEESVKRIGGTIGWGAAGAVLLGPVGLLAGLLLGGKKKEVTFVARLKDGRKLLGATDNKVYMQIMSNVF